MNNDNPQSHTSSRPSPDLRPRPDSDNEAARVPSAKPTQESPAGWVYTDIVKEHFLNPRNFLMGDESQYAHDAEGVVGNPVCGDQMKMFIRIETNIENGVKCERITDVKWKTYGCASAIASTSALSELAKGKTLDEALRIGPAEITEFLGGLPKHKFHCSVLGHEALAAAIQNYRNACEKAA